MEYAVAWLCLYLFAASISAPSISLVSFTLTTTTQFYTAPINHLHISIFIEMAAMTHAQATEHFSSDNAESIRSATVSKGKNSFRLENGHM
jgi:hypothetical protein